jgi:hypothetical protein
MGDKDHRRLSLIREHRKRLPLYGSLYLLSDQRFFARLIRIISFAEDLI